MKWSVHKNKFFSCDTKDENEKNKKKNIFPVNRFLVVNASKYMLVIFHSKKLTLRWFLQERTPVRLIDTLTKTRVASILKFVGPLIMWLLTHSGSFHINLWIIEQMYVVAFERVYLGQVLQKLDEILE